MSNRVDKIEKSEILNSRDGLRRPGEVLKDFLNSQNLKQESAAELLGITRQYLNRLLNSEEFRLTGDLILKVAALTRRSADYWSHLEEDWQNSREGLAIGRVNLSEKFEEGLSTLGVTQLVDHQVRRAIYSGAICISEFQENHLEGASYDLTIGGVDPIDEDLRSADDGIYWLEPGESALVSTAESLQLSMAILGRLGPMMKLAHKGLNLITGPQIDPGFEGHISVAITNLSKRTKSLRLGDTFLSVDFCLLRYSPEKKWTPNGASKDDQKVEVESPENLRRNDVSSGSAMRLGNKISEGGLSEIEAAMSIRLHPELTFMSRLRKVEEELEIEEGGGTVRERLAKIREAFGS